MSEKKGAQANGSAHRTHDDGSKGRAFTVEQKAAVIRVKRCKPGDFYDILGLEDVRSTCSDSEIKKAYRKLSLLTHPDKNGYEGADEAFKCTYPQWNWKQGHGGLLTSCANSCLESVPNIIGLGQKGEIRQIRW